MRENERGDAVAIGIIAIVILLGLQIFVFTYSNMEHARYKELYDRWASECITQGGMVGKVSSDRSECFINGKKVVLKGWEMYQ